MRKYPMYPNSVLVVKRCTRGIHSFGSLVGGLKDFTYPCSWYRGKSTLQRQLDQPSDSAANILSTCVVVVNSIFEEAIAINIAIHR
jgi:hypothetical protein